MKKLLSFRNDDGGYTFIAALSVFVLLGATFMVFIAAAQNQLGQSRINKQTISNAYGNDTALARALDFLNGELTDPAGAVSDEWLVSHNPATPPLPTSEAGKFTFTDGDTVYSWWIVDHPANTTRQQSATIHTEATTLGRTTKREHRITAIGVGTYYTNSDGDAVYNVTPHGAWRDGIGISTAPTAGTGGQVTSGDVLGTMGIYGDATVMNRTNNGGFNRIPGGFTAYDARAKFEGSTYRVSYYPVTTDLNGKHAQTTEAACPVNPSDGNKHKGIWSNTPFSAASAGTTLIATPSNPSASCWMGMNMPSSDQITVSGGGVYTLYIRDNPNLTRNYIGGRFNIVGDTQLHLIFEGARGLSGQPVVFNNGSTTTAHHNPNGLFVFAPVSACEPQYTTRSYDITGSLVCKSIKQPSFFVTQMAPKSSPLEPITRNLYIKDESR